MISVVDRMNPTPTIFLSYAHNDRHCAERLAAILSARGVSVWWDRNIRAGRPFERVIEEALTEAQIVLVLWSQSSVGSDWVRAEASYALEANKLLPLNLDGTQLPLRFRLVQTVPLTSWNEAENTPEWALFFEEIDQRLALLNEARHALEPHKAEEVRLAAEQERAALERREAEAARREIQHTGEAPERPNTNQLASPKPRSGALQLLLTFYNILKKGHRRERSGQANSRPLQISVALFGAAILSFLILSKIDDLSRWVVALGERLAPPTSSPSATPPATVSATQPALQSIEPPSTASPPEPAASHGTLQATGAVSEPQRSPTTGSPNSALDAPERSAPATQGAIWEPTALPPAVPTTDTAAVNRGAPSPSSPSGEITMAIQGPPALALATTADVAPTGTSFRTIVPTKLLQQPDKSAKMLAELKSDTEVIVEGASERGWYKVKAPVVSSEGFVAANTVQETRILEAAEWLRIEKRKDAKSFRSFLQNYPHGAHAEAARARLEMVHRAVPASSPPAPQTRVRSDQDKCATITERMQLGEPISDADRAILSGKCH